MRAPAHYGRPGPCSWWPTSPRRRVFEGEGPVGVSEAISSRVLGDLLCKYVCAVKPVFLPSFFFMQDIAHSYRYARFSSRVKVSSNDSRRRRRTDSTACRHCNMAPQGMHATLMAIKGDRSSSRRYYPPRGVRCCAQDGFVRAPGTPPRGASRSRRPPRTGRGCVFKS
jgi:hypothetical protein